MVLVFTAVAFLVTWLFRADVNAQDGAYATGVLVLTTSASVAVTIAARRARQHGRTVAFGAIAVVLAYTMAANVVERPDGVKTGACFVGGIVAVSVLSRLSRARELRVTGVVLDGLAARFVRDMAHRKVQFIANEPQRRDAAEYREKLRQIRVDNDIPPGEDLVFVEVTVRDPSEFETELDVRGQVLHGRYRVLTLQSATVPNALAALLPHVRDLTGKQPHIYFEWTEGSPFVQFLRSVPFGQGEVASVTREVLRKAEPDRSRRPHVRVA